MVTRFLIVPLLGALLVAAPSAMALGFSGLPIYPWFVVDLPNRVTDFTKAWADAPRVDEDVIAERLRAGEVEDALLVSERTLASAGSEASCRLKALAAVSRHASGRTDGIDALLDGCFTDSPVRPLLDLMVAKAACAGGFLKAARASLRRARRAFLPDDSLLRARADALETRCMIELAPPKYALRSVDDFISTYPEAPMGLEMEVARAGILVRLHREREACAAAREIVMRQGEQPAAAGAVEVVRHLEARDLCRARRSSQRLSTASWLVRMKKWERVADDIDWIVRWLDDPEISDEARESANETVYRYFECSSRYGDAEAFLRRGSSLSGQGWLDVADLRQASGDLRGTFEALRKVPMHSKVRLERETRVLRDFGRMAEAAPRYRKLLEGRRRPPSELLFEAGLAEWLGGHPDTAVAHFSELVRRNGKRRDRYFLALSKVAVGRIDDAAAEWKALSTERPEGWYGLLAASRLSELGMRTADRAGAALLPYEPARLAQLASVRPAGPSAPAARAGVDVDRLGHHLDEAVASVGHLLPRLERARAAYEIGLHEDMLHDLRASALDVHRARRARGKLRKFLSRAPGSTLDNRDPPTEAWGKRYNPWARVPSKRKKRIAMIERVEALKKLWRSPEMHPFVRLLSAAGEPMLPRIWALSHGGRRATADATLQRWSFPMPWTERVSSLAVSVGVPKVLLYAIMNIESAFHAEAISRANARGLFQVMPQTATRLALDAGVNPPDEADMLDRRLSMDLGARYLGMLLEEFGGQIPLSLAGYNAGPHRVKEWLRQRGHLPLDVFVELIPYGQARGYVKKGTSRLASMLRVHYGITGLYVSRALDSRTSGRLDY